MGPCSVPILQSPDFPNISTNPIFGNNVAQTFHTSLKKTHILEGFNFNPAIGHGYVAVVAYFPQRWPLGLLCHPYIIDTPPTVVLLLHSVKVFERYMANQRGRKV